MEFSLKSIILEVWLQNRCTLTTSVMLIHPCCPSIYNGILRYSFLLSSDRNLVRNYSRYTLYSCFRFITKIDTVKLSYSRRVEAIMNFLQGIEKKNSPFSDEISRNF